MLPGTRRDSRSRTARRSVNVALLQVPHILVVLLWCSAVKEAAGWKDEGHMLVAAVARQYMKPTTINRVEAALQFWKTEYPTTSTLETSAVWLDHLPCAQAGEYCKDFLRQDGIRLFKSWHYCSVPWNPQNIPLRPIDQAMPLPNSGADWALATIYKALKGCTSTKRTRRGSLESPGLGKRNPLPRHKRSSMLQLRTTAAVRRQPDRSEVQAAEKSERGQWHWTEGKKVSDKGSDLLSDSEEVSMYPEDAALEAETDDESDSPAALATVEGEFAFTETSSQSKALTPTASPLPEGGVCSILAYSLYLRLLIHIFGDIHQPLHASEVYSKVFPRGDIGGNTIYVDLSTAKEKNAHQAVEFKDSTRKPKKMYTHNLHGEWDGLFGNYEKYFHQIDLKKLREEARRLTKLYPREDEARTSYNDFTKIIRESHQIVKDFVYSEFDWNTFSYDFLPYKPSRKYIERTRKIGEERIVLAGMRLGFLLDSIADFLPSSRPLSPAAALPTAGTQASRGTQAAFVERAAGFPEHAAHKLEGDATPRWNESPTSAYEEGSSDSDADESGGPWSFSSDESDNGRQTEFAGLGGALSAFSAPLGIAFCVMMLLFLILLVALCIAWRQLRFYKQAFQAVIRRGGTTVDVSAPADATAAAEAGDWRTAAAALLSQYKGKEQGVRHDDVGSEASTVFDAAVDLRNTTSRLLES